MAIKYKCESCGKECGERDYYPSVVIGFYAEPLRSEQIHALFRAKTVLVESQEVEHPRTGSYYHGAVKTLVEPGNVSMWRWGEVGYCSECLEEFRLMYLKYMSNMLTAFKKKIKAKP